MPDLLTFARGKNSEIFQSDAFALGTLASEPPDVTIEVDTGVAAGATSVTLSCASTIVLRRNLILAFADGATTVLVRVTEETTIGSGGAAVPVDAVAGDLPGIPGALTTSHEAVWDQLHRVIGTESAGFSMTDNVQALTPATYESAFAGTTWAEDEATSKAWSIARSGRFKGADYALSQVELAQFEEREVWVKVVYPDEEGTPVRIYEGRARVRNLSVDPPATGVVDASWTWQGQGRPKRTDLTANGS
jgi:hypothetical protein